MPGKFLGICPDQGIHKAKWVPTKIRPWDSGCGVSTCFHGILATTLLGPIAQTGVNASTTRG